MAGKIIADQIEHSTAGSLDTSYVVQGSAKVFIDIPSGQASINTSLNVSSLDDDGTGDGGINFTSSLDSVNYAIVVASQDGGSNSPVRDHDVTDGTQAASSYDFETFYVTSTNNRTDNDCRTYSAKFGDLA
jgi:hypothetical protein